MSQRTLVYICKELEPHPLKKTTKQATETFKFKCLIAPKLAVMRKQVKCRAINVLETTL